MTRKFHVQRIYLRVTEDGHVLGSDKPNHKPIYRGGHPVPTAAFAIEVEIPSERFKAAEQMLAQIKLVPESVDIATEVIYPERT